MRGDGAVVDDKAGFEKTSGDDLDRGGFPS